MNVMTTARWMLSAAYLTCALAMVGVGHLHPLVGGWVVMASAMTFLIFGMDKRRAAAGQRRISEAALLWSCVFGGWPGGLMAQNVFQHKTRKWMFQLSMWVSALTWYSMLGMVALMSLEAL